MTLTQLKLRTAKDLAQLAKRKGIAGWHTMRKDELIRALLKVAKSDPKSDGVAAAGPAAQRNGSNGCSAAVSSAKRNGNGKAPEHSGNGKLEGRRDSGLSKPRPARVERRIDQIKAKLAQSKDLAHHTPGNGDGPTRDRLVVMVRDPYWLHACWELTRQSIERARAALGPLWHGAKPVLRVLEVARDGTTSSVRRKVRDIEIHGGVNNWYVDVDDPPKGYQMEIGYLALDGRFVSLGRSNVVTTPQVGSLKTFDGNWAESGEDFDRIYALSGGYSDDGDQSDLRDLLEERLHRPVGSPMVARFGRGACGPGGKREFNFEVDAELIVYGVTDPDAQVTLRGEPVRLQADGTFSMRFSLPDRRQVLPVVASSGDGVEQRTIVLAVERNTKVMEPVTLEPEA